MEMFAYDMITEEHCEHFWAYKFALKIGLASNNLAQCDSDVKRN